MENKNSDKTDKKTYSSSFKIVTWNKEDYYKILDLLYEKVYPEPFVPLFSPNDENIYLFDNGAASRKLKDTLGVKPYGYDHEKTFSLTYGKTISTTAPLKGEFLKILLTNELKECRTEKTVLNLQSFHLRTNLLASAYFPLFYRPNVAELLKITYSNMFINLKTINLGGNNIEEISIFEIPKWAPNITTLLLENNRLSSIRDIASLRGLDLQVLKLNGNPIVSKYSVEDYRELMLVLFPRLKTLDRVLKKNVEIYSVEPSGLKLAMDFIKIYYNIYDSNEREHLSELYHSTATFTLSCQINEKLSRFLKWRRSVIEDKKGESNVFKTSEAIVRCLQTMPKSQHDILSFNLDVPYHTYNQTLIHLKGYFKIPASNVMQDETVYEFCRTFMLKNENFRYTITNDMLAVKSVPENQLERAFRKTCVKEKPSHLFPEKGPNPEQKQLMVILLKRICELSPPTCERILDATKWNFVAAVKESMTWIKTKGFVDK